MRTYIRLAGRYLSKYPQRTVAMVLSIALSVFLIVTIGSLTESSRNVEVRQCKAHAGPQHVMYKGLNAAGIKKIRTNPHVKQMATLCYYDAWNTPKGLTVNLLAADAGILYMENTQLQSGRFPARVGEIAMEGWVLDQLRLPHQPGQNLKISLQEKGDTGNYTLVGIIKDRLDEKSTGQLEAFIASNNENLTGNENRIIALVEFKEGVKINEEIKQLGADLGLNPNPDSGHVVPNKWLLSALGQLNTVDWNLVKIALVLMLVGGMVIYSIYGISVLKRVQDYGIIRAIGSSSRQIICIIMWEIAIIYILGVVLGIISGTAFIQFFKGTTTDLFAGSMETLPNMRLEIIVISAFAVKLSILVSLGAILAAGLRAALMVNKISPIAAINKSSQDEKINLREKESWLESWLGIPRKISLKNLRRNKKVVIFTVLAMSIGCTLFMVESFRCELFERDRDYRTSILGKHQENEFKLNVNLTAPMKTGYTEEQIARLKQLPSVQEVSAHQVLYARLKLNKRQLNGNYGENYIKYMNKREAGYENEKAADVSDRPEDKRSFAFTGSYADELVIRSTVLGLSAPEWKALSKILADKKLDMGMMSEKPLAILHIPEVNSNGSFLDKTGQDKYKPALNVRAGDKIKLTFPRQGYEKSLSNWNLIYKYKKYQDLYIDQEFIVAGVIRDLPETDDFLLGSEQAPYMLISNQIFRELTGINTYRLISIDMKDEYSASDYQVLKEKVQETAELIPGTSMADRVQFLQEMEESHRRYLFLLGAIAAILISIGGLSIYNNIYYNLLSRLREHGIMKAIGMTRRQFKEMVRFEGLMYGAMAAVFSCGLALVIELGCFLYYAYLVTYPLMYKKFFIEWKSLLLIIIINLAIGYIATLGPGRQVNRIEITESIRTVE